MVIVWELLGDDNAQFHDLGPDFCDSRVNLSRKMRNHGRKLQALGYKVTLEPPPGSSPRRSHPVCPARRTLKPAQSPSFSD